MTLYFDFDALQDAVDVRRKERGLSWAQVASETGVSVSTIRKMQNGRVAEGDGVLSVLRWLGRTPESFIPGSGGTATRLPEIAEGSGVVRFDTHAIYEALDARRTELGMSWREMAATIGVGHAAGLTHLRNGGRVSFPGIVRILAWLGEPVARYTHITPR